MALFTHYTTGVLFAFLLEILTIALQTTTKESPDKSRNVSYGG